MKTTTRKKTVFDTNEIAHIWAYQTQDYARNAHDNFYFRDKTIYSYGSHFPIATIANENTVLFTLRTYSNTTTKHIYLAKHAVSHFNIIYCYDVPVYLEYASNKHEANVNFWKGKIKALFDELGNKRIRDIQSRVNEINGHISQLKQYTDFFKFKIKDKELLQMLSLANDADFLSKAREAKEKAEKAKELRLSKAIAAYNKYVLLWRNYDNEGIKKLTDKEKDLCNYFSNNATIFYTRLRYNKELKRVETSKGVQIPASVAKLAYFTLNGCFKHKCNDLSIPVMNYTITQSTDKYIIAGCHTIPNEDVQYIADLLGWTKESLHVNESGNLESI